MAFTLAKADKDAIGQVNITGKPSGFSLNSGNLQFPPTITKDSKSANWQTTDLMSYEPLAFFKSANPRDLGLEFQWVVGGQWSPEKVHKTIDDVKKYFYTCYMGSAFQEYPIVEITKLFNLITQRTTWRMNSVNVTYSPELVNIGGKWYPLHVKLTMDLLSVTKLKGDASGDTPMQELSSLEDSPKPGWY
jgi:hypothetical protein